jgi:uncharacterized protein YndB with AHSA1/START domain
MPGGTFTTTIQAPPEKVWAVVADLSKLKQSVESRA